MGFLFFFVAWICVSPLGLDSASIACYFYMVVCANFKLVLGTTWNIWMHIVIWGSIILFILFGIGYNSNIILNVVPDAYHTFYVLWSYPQFYLGLLLIVVWAMLPDFVWVAFTRNFNPRPKHIIQEIRQIKKEAPAQIE